MRKSKGNTDAQMCCTCNRVINYLGDCHPEGFMEGMENGENDLVNLDPSHCICGLRPYLC